MLKMFCSHGVLKHKCPLCRDILDKETRMERLLRLEREAEEQEIENNKQNENEKIH